jgi:pimeloyl-ACP methyl ester carboxylesterase
MPRMRARFAFVLAFATAALPVVVSADDSEQGLREAIDAYLDARWDAPPDATRKLVERIEKAGLDAKRVEEILRSGRVKVGPAPQEKGVLVTGLPLVCEHLDHETRYLIYVPTSYDPKKASPLLVVGHGGSSGRDLAFGEYAARLGIEPFWIQQAEKEGWVLLAPLTDRGWGAVGYSILFSAISKVTREYRIDPDRVYLTGHSMGGHLTYRSAMTFADRWAAVSPMSGGYDYVKDGQILAFWNVPGFVTFGKQEPYGIDGFNRKMAVWIAERKWPWIYHEKEGGHEIFADEIPLVAKFFDEHPRDLYRKSVFARGGGRMVFDTPEKNPAWNKEHTWRSGRGIPSCFFHWIRLLPLPENTPAEKARQTVLARLAGDNVIEIASENVRTCRVYLHPRMVDFSRPVTIRANGEVVFQGKVAPDLATMLELVRETDDRGRIFQAAVDVKIATDKPVPDPGPEGVKRWF